MPASNTSAFFPRFRSLIALLLMTVALSVLSDHFLTTANGLTILRQVSINMCLSLGMTLVILSGGIDLSVGALLGFSGAVAAGLLKNGLALPAFGLQLQFTTSGAILAGVLVGAVLGWHNGVAITRFRLPPFIATLGMLSVARGLAYLWTGGFPITGLGASFGTIGTGACLGVPVPVWIMVALIAVFLVVTQRTRFGRHLYAVGGNARAARLTGLDVDRIKVAVYTLAGALAGVAGLIVTSRLDSAQPNAGLSYELDAIAAVVIGGTSLSGGRGTVFGTVLGCLIIGVLNNGLFLLDVSPFWQLVIKGYVILVAVAIDQASAPRNRDA
jgi:ribose transport system permease protein